MGLSLLTLAAFQAADLVSAWIDSPGWSAPNPPSTGITGLLLGITEPSELTALGAESVGMTECDGMTECRAILGVMDTGLLYIRISVAEAVGATSSFTGLCWIWWSFRWPESSTNI